MKVFWCSFVLIVSGYNSWAIHGQQKDSLDYRLKANKETTFEIQLVSQSPIVVTINSPLKQKETTNKGDWLVLAVSGYSANDLFFIDYAYAVVKKRNNDGNTMKLALIAFGDSHSFESLHGKSKGVTPLWTVVRNGKIVAHNEGGFPLSNGEALTKVIGRWVEKALQ